MARLGWPAPFAPRALPRFVATTRQSVPWCRLCTLALVVQTTCGFSVDIDTEGSHVPHDGLFQTQPTYMPDAAPSVSRFRRSLSHDLLATVVLTSSEYVSTRIRWFPCGPLSGSHLTQIFLLSLFLLRSLPRILSAAAEGGLSPTPTSRFEGPTLIRRTVTQNENIS